MKTGVFRGGCLTGPFHSGVKLHGFLSYMVRVALRGETYTIIGYKGKQVRDQIHSEDVVRAFEASTRTRGRARSTISAAGDNAASLLELLDKIEHLIGRPFRGVRPAARVGDHICYITDLAKFRSHYPDWELTRGLDEIVADVVRGARAAML